MKKTSQSGRSMVEMLGVIAIIGLITIGGIVSTGYVDSYFRINSTALEVDSIAQDIIDTYSWSRNYDGLNVEIICEEANNDDICSTTVVTEGDATRNETSMRNKWGGSINIAPSADANRSSFSITYLGIPENSCLQLAQMDSFQYVVVESNTCNSNNEADRGVVFVEKFWEDGE